MSEESKAKHASALVLAGMIVLTIGVLVFREALSRYSLLGYPTLFIACFLMNVGVFGISPSGLVAVEASFIYDPLAVAVLAGVGSGLGEIGSYVTGRAGKAIAPPSIARRIEPLYGLPVFLCAFVTSFISGNFSDAYGLMIGARGNSLASFITGVTLAKVMKMILLVWIARVGQAEII